MNFDLILGGLMALFVIGMTIFLGGLLIIGSFKQMIEKWNDPLTDLIEKCLWIFIFVCAVISPIATFYVLIFY